MSVKNETPPGDAKRWQPKPNKGWPRDIDLGAHSPLFFAENKDRFLRQALVRDIQVITGRPLAVYFASPFLTSRLRNEDVRRLFEVIEPFKGLDFDLMIETGGGETDATEALVSLVQGVASSFRAIVPLRAKSNGTLLCLAANEIIMGCTSELGPVEPSVDFVPVSVLMHESYTSKDQRLKLMGEFAFNQTRDLARKLLHSGMMHGRSAQEINETVDALCTRKSYASHGSVINASEAERLGLKVTLLPPENELWRKLFLLHCLYSFDSEIRNISKFFEQETFSHSVVGDDPPFELNGN